MSPTCSQLTAPQCRALAGTLLCALLLPPVSSADFIDDLERVDEAIKKNPNRVLRQAVDSCINRRRFAIVLYKQNQEARADRALKACVHLLQIPETAPPKKIAAASAEELRANATRELERALALEPDIGRGLEIYRICAACHSAEGWGLSNGSVPQIAGQHRRVIVKQLVDIRAGNRDTVLMSPYSSAESIGGAQAVADVAAYIDSLEISVETGKGLGDDLELGERLYAESCARCHGPDGEGNDATFVPRIQSQHFDYLVRQFKWIRDGKRRNADAEMATQIRDFRERETNAVLDWVARLEPPEELQAPPGWQNPDFVD